MFGSGTGPNWMSGHLIPAMPALFRNLAERLPLPAILTPGGGSAQDESRKDCLFCSRHDEELNRIMCENQSFFARYDNFPANPGHLEIVPKRHVESFFDLSDREIVEAYALIREARARLTREFDPPHGYTIGVNEGRAAGRSVDHLHVHLIPRYEGDVKDARGGVRQAAPNCDPDSWG
jgi:diadenosine tetraphosphate (Ap4A) HIT family hydrolase